ncbi:hypothetical protein SAMN05421783_14119 [Thiocapsa roseopersicina]|uniref:Uncharacterized protein n=1 Tax=Thiocapsa roseopersicina TaxID=1058 RepID=A0A1H3D3Y2_THIRO|nr:hypothetical protein SAMN05421783_14119 [Thiocapsa roseopersicina]
MPRVCDFPSTPTAAPLTPSARGLAFSIEDHQHGIDEHRPGRSCRRLLDRRREHHLGAGRGPESEPRCAQADLPPMPAGAKASVEPASAVPRPVLDMPHAQPCGVLLPLGAPEQPHRHVWGSASFSCGTTKVTISGWWLPYTHPRPPSSSNTLQSPATDPASTGPHARSNTFASAAGSAVGCLSSPTRARRRRR